MELTPTAERLDEVLDLDLQSISDTMDDQDPKVREVLTALTDEELTMLRVATRPFDGHPGVDSGTIAYYKPEFLALALNRMIEDHQTTTGAVVGPKGSKGMTSKGLTIALELLEKFHAAKFPGVKQEDLFHAEVSRDDEAGREAHMADRAVIEGGAE